MWPLSHFDARSLLFVKVFDDAGRPDILFGEISMKLKFSGINFDQN